jgi:eukaryotic-like serine/threonine-protein kinase
MSIQRHSNDRNPLDNISCPRCHTQLPIRAVFCSSCGERVEKIPASRPSRSDRLRKPGVLLPVVLTLLVGIIFGAGLWIYEVYHSPASATSVSTSAHKATPLHSPASTAVLTPSPIFPLNIAGLYRGTIFDLSAHVTTEMYLTGIQQDQRGISGNFTGLHLTGTFNGAIDPSKHIHFMVQDSAGQLILSFDGDMQSEGELSGNYCSVNQDERCTGEYGLWSVAPAS